jgi:sulfite dehydrogenase
VSPEPVSPAPVSPEPVRFPAVGRRAVAVRRLGRGGLVVLLAAGLLAPGWAADPLAVGRKLFTETAAPKCALCHTLKDAGSQGAIGPVLDEIKPDAERVAAALRGGVGLMPSYEETLTEEQIKALALYVSKASGGAN